ncbi:hypothetical protein PVAP13_4KG072900 [Panicum virgatum]|uniref:Uncharacterized protein n=1 Tax=Panicum virgatum TaxID=38727 RepID=A0A8T0TDJ3_PANVG|nr:hypothetical protein PVAP13_4KG072900 [Panicum virgatum]
MSPARPRPGHFSIPPAPAAPATPTPGSPRAGAPGLAFALKQGFAMFSRPRGRGRGGRWRGGNGRSLVATPGRRRAPPRRGPRARRQVTAGAKAKRAPVRHEVAVGGAPRTNPPHRPFPTARSPPPIPRFGSVPPARSGATAREAKLACDRQKRNKRDPERGKWGGRKTPRESERDSRRASAFANFCFACSARRCARALSRPGEREESGRGEP